MTGRVGLGRRLQHSDRRRAALSVLGAAGGLLIVLVTGALFAGFHAQETAYLDRSPAEIVVSQRGVGTMQLSLSSLPPDARERAEGVDGVAWVEPIRHLTTTIRADEGPDLVSYVFGYDVASGLGGPQDVVDGRPPGRGEVVVDRAGARTLGLDVGDELHVLGAPLRVSGLTDGLTSLANTTVFLSMEQFALLAGSGTSYLLVGAVEGVAVGEVVERLRTAVPDLQVQTRDAFVAQEAALVRDMYTGVIRAMQAAGFVVAYALLALSLAMATRASRPAYAVVRALGGSTGHLARTVMVQAALVVLAATALATALAMGISALTEHAAPNLHLVVRPRDVVGTAALALAVGGIGALLPAVRVARVDPTTTLRARG
jgi:putative ABC transport system permease protein